MSESIIPITKYDSATNIWYLGSFIIIISLYNYYI